MATLNSGKDPCSISNGKKSVQNIIRTFFHMNNLDLLALERKSIVAQHTTVGC
jgi:hypothetical protein